MTTPIKIALAIATLTLSAQALAQITLYENDGWRGRAVTTNKPIRDFSRGGFNDRSSSVIVESGRWEVCDDANFRGNCMVLRKGSYDSLSRMGMNDRISSVRPAARRNRYDNEAPEPLPVADYEYRRRPNENVFQAPVTSARAVVGADEQRCWIERGQVTQQHNNSGVGGAIAGAVIGGILGHQVGGGTGRDVATAGGAVAGAAIGSNMGSRSGQTTSQDVRRCENVPSQTPAYWDVTYRYRGTDHRIQMASAPGNTIAVNRNGEPRQ
ncbi:glycine zipper 2TM domain-containing protein [Oxalobacteraceae bacterium]|nr:glycine zipper 2TM domain-containing protein [Oxalobacteraceae bacterium]